MSAQLPSLPHLPKDEMLLENHLNIDLNDPATLAAILPLLTIPTGPILSISTPADDVNYFALLQELRQTDVDNDRHPNQVDWVETEAQDFWWRWNVVTETMGYSREKYHWYYLNQDGTISRGRMGPNLGKSCSKELMPIFVIWMAGLASYAQLRHMLEGGEEA